jgi:hypothetical protein
VPRQIQPLWGNDPLRLPVVVEAADKIPVRSLGHERRKLLATL